MPKTKMTGVVTVVRCTKCGKESSEFASSNRARNWAYNSGWLKLGSAFICPTCSRVLGLYKRCDPRELQ